MDIEIRTGLDVRKAMAAKQEKIKGIQDQVSRLEKAMQEDQPRSGCLSWLFRRRSRQTSAALDKAVFGHKSTASSSASDRLSTAAQSMEAHAESLGERAAAARAKAKSFMASGKKAEALAWMKKAKQAESQHSNAVATHAALERQIDVLAESALQKEVATALSASVAGAKKKRLHTQHPRRLRGPGRCLNTATKRRATSPTKPRRTPTQAVSGLLFAPKTSRLTLRRRGPATTPAKPRPWPVNWRRRTSRSCSPSSKEISCPHSPTPAPGRATPLN